MSKRGNYNAKEKLNSNNQGDVQKKTNTRRSAKGAQSKERNSTMSKRGNYNAKKGIAQ